MIFQKISKPDNEILKIFIPYRKNFIYSSKTASKQLKRIIKISIAFYKVFFEPTGYFDGCLFVDCIDEDNKIIEFGGFAARHAHTKEAITELIAYLKYHYPNYKIKAKTEFLVAKISLIRAGFKKKENGDYIYD